MYADERKIRLISTLLKIKDDKVLSEIEHILNRYENKIKERPCIDDFVGFISESDAIEMKKAIAEL